jgi:arylsulfatase A-like enzyme
MPNLERFARDHAVIFDRGVANGSSSLPSHASLFTGLYPPNHGAHQIRLDDPSPPAYGYPLPDDVPTLSALLAQHGYWSVGISGNFGPLSPEFGLARGFDSYSAVSGDALARNGFSPFAIESRWSKRIPSALMLFARLNEVPPFREADYFMDVPYRRASTITDAALEVLEIAGDRPFFLFLNYLDAHRPYYAPSPYRTRYEGFSPDLHPTGIDMETRTAVLRGERKLSAAEHAHVTALYDGELAYLDAELERLFEALRHHPSWDEMIVLITSDHGEAFGDHGHLYHSINLYDESLHVPTIIKPGSDPPPGFAPGSRRGGVIQSVDLFATVLAQTGIAPTTTIDGVAWGLGRRDGLGWLYVAEVNLGFSAELYRRELVAIERDGFKLIRSSDGTLELYDTARDPGEAHDLTEAERDHTQDLVHTLDALGIESRAVSPGGGPLSDDAMTRLRALGYVE